MKELDFKFSPGLRKTSGVIGKPAVSFMNRWARAVLFVFWVLAFSAASRLAGQSNVAAAAEPGPETALGAVEGVITFQGEIPKSSVPDNSGARRRILEVDGASGGLRNVVAYLTPTNGPPLSAPPATAGRESGTKAAVDQRDHEFTPRVIAVREGEPVLFSNSDPANHNVRASASVAGNAFNVYTGVEGKYEHRFVAEPEYRPIRLGCDIHPWMRGWVYVFDHPYFAVTDEKGRFRIGRISPGEYRLHLIQPDLKHREQRHIEVRANQTRRVETVIRSGENKSP